MGTDKVLDPVCGMQVAADTPLHATHEGRDYRFCSRHCLERFESDPERYTAPAPAGKADDHGAIACCTDHGARSHRNPGTDRATYTCPMHPEVRKRGPGDCPRCGMALEPEHVGTPLTRVAYTCPMHPDDRA